MLFSPAYLAVAPILPVFTLALPKPPNRNATAPNVSVSTFHQFLLGTWIEILAIRPSGSILTVGYSPNNQANIYSVPLTINSTAALVHTFAGINGVTGIATLESEVNYIVTAAFNFSSFSAIPGTAAIHRLSFDACDRPFMEEITKLPEIYMPNGMIHTPNTPYFSSQTP